MPFVASPGASGACASIIHSAIMTTHARRGARDLYAVFPFLGPFLCRGLQSSWSFAPRGRTSGPECLLKRGFVGVWPGILFLQQSYSLLEHSHLGLVSLHHSHHLRFQLLQLVLMLLLCFLIGSHQVTVWEQREMSRFILRNDWHPLPCGAGEHSSLFCRDPKPRD